MNAKSIFVLIGILMAFNSTISYAERFLIVNGQRLNNQQISYLEQIHCGPIPNGSYWLNFNSGLWGYAGNPAPQGYITDNCNRSQQRPSLSERGLLYSPGELLR